MRARREGFFSVGSGFFDAMTWRACPSNAKVDEAQRKSFFRVFWGGVVGWVGLGIERKMEKKSFE
jgi:hypothetical protein